MSSYVRSIMDSGFDGLLIEIECNLTNNLPTIVIVGMANKSLDEAKERIRSGLNNQNIPIPRKRITLNLAPADIAKEGAAYDLAMCGAIMLANQEQRTNLPIEKTVFIGEVGLDGSIRGVRGIIGKIRAAKRLGITTFVVPMSNLAQAHLIKDVILYPLQNLHELYCLITNSAAAVASTKSSGQIDDQQKQQLSYQDISEVIGQSRAKRALEIAAAGYHNILLHGPPGTGKSMLAKIMPSLLPDMSTDDILDVTHLHSLGNKNFESLVTTRPFRSPHHSASHIAIVGGGQNPKPGEISLAHRGILFLDEFPEFGRQTIESLRQPLEDRVVSISRAKDSVQYPANFILVATANPCPCGYYGSNKECTCTTLELQRYQKKLSGPILDRIDIHVAVEDIDHDKLLSTQVCSDTTEVSKSRIANAQQRQIHRARTNNLSKHRNSEWDNKTIKNHANIVEDALILLNTAAGKLKLSARGYMRVVRVARTIADLDASEDIKSEHIAEALQYRPSNKINILS